MQGAQAEPGSQLAAATSSPPIQTRISAAAASGVLDLKGCATDEALAAAQELPAVYVADLRGSGWVGAGAFVCPMGWTGVECILLAST